MEKVERSDQKKKQKSVSRRDVKSLSACELIVYDWSLPQGQAVVWLLKLAS